MNPYRKRWVGTVNHEYADTLVKFVDQFNSIQESDIFFYPALDVFVTRIGKQYADHWRVEKNNVWRVSFTKEYDYSLRAGHLKPVLLRCERVYKGLKITHINNIKAMERDLLVLKMMLADS